MNQQYLRHNIKVIVWKNTQSIQLISMIVFILIENDGETFQFVPISSISFVYEKLPHSYKFNNNIACVVSILLKLLNKFCSRHKIVTFKQMNLAFINYAKIIFNMLTNATRCIAITIRVFASLLLRSYADYLKAL